MTTATTPPDNEISENTVLQNTKTNLQKLDIQRKALEEEAKAITDELLQKIDDTTEPMGIDTPLVDREGYPRADIDVYRARSLRKRLKEIQTDYKLLMVQIERGLVELSSFSSSNSESKQQENDKELQARLAPSPKPKFDPKTGLWTVKNWDGTVSGIRNGHLRSFDTLQEQNPSNIVQTATTTSEETEVVQQQQQQDVTVLANMDNTTTDESQINNNIDWDTLLPFALIDEVFPSSPADEAGLKVGDLVVQFGSVDYTNHNGLRAIPDIVTSAASVGGDIRLGIVRKEEGNDGNDSRDVSSRNVILLIKPRPWAGRGLLGCHLNRHTS